MLHRRARSLATLLVPAALALACCAATPAAAPAAPRDVISGRWLVSHTCLSVCTGSRRFVETVHHRAGNVYAGTGDEAQVLYQIGRQVLVHAPTNSVLLTIRQPGRLMSGLGVASDGATLSVTWRCVAPHAAPGAAPGATAAGVGAAPSGSTLRAFEVC